METLRRAHYKNWIVVTTLAVWWLYASMVFCAAFASFGQKTSMVAQDALMQGMASMSHQHGGHDFSAHDFSENANTHVDHSIDGDAHSFNQRGLSENSLSENSLDKQDQNKPCSVNPDHHSSSSGSDKQLCCDDLQEGSVSGQSAPSLFLVVFLSWAVTIIEPAKPLFSVFFDSAVPISLPPIYILVCSFLK